MHAFSTLGTNRLLFLLLSLIACLTTTNRHHNYCGYYFTLQINDKHLWWSYKEQHRGINVEDSMNHWQGHWIHTHTQTAKQDLDMSRHETLRCKRKIIHSIVQKSSATPLFFYFISKKPKCLVIFRVVMSNSSKPSPCIRSFLENALFVCLLSY